MTQSHEEKVQWNNAVIIGNYFMAGLMPLYKEVKNSSA